MRGGSVKLARGVAPKYAPEITPDPGFSADDLRIEQWMGTTVCIII